MRYFMNTFAYNYALVEQVKDTWMLDNTDTIYAKIVANDLGDGSKNFVRTSSAFNFKADYMCIREVILNYNTPENLYADLGIQNAKIYVSGNNLHYFTSIIRSSPERGASTSYSGSYSNLCGVSSPKLCFESTTFFIASSSALLRGSSF